MEQKNRRISTRQLVSMAMLGAISIVLVAVIHFPLIPAAAFLEYDPADIPILICAFAYGPLAGLLLTVVVCFIQGFTVSAQSGIIGIVMHIFATGCCVLVTGSIYKRNKTRKTAVIALILGALVQTAAMVLMNMIFTPLFMGAPLETVLALMIPAIIPFNVLKAGINGVIYLLFIQIHFPSDEGEIQIKAKSQDKLQRGFIFFRVFLQILCKILNFMLFLQVFIVKERESA